MKIPRPNRRALAGSAALLAVAAAVVVGRVSAPDPAPTPAPVAAAPAPASAVQASVICDLYGPTFLVTIPPGQHPVLLAPGEEAPGIPAGTSYGEFEFAPSTGATTARFHLSHLVGTAWLQGPAEHPARDVPYTCPPLPGDPPGAHR